MNSYPALYTLQAMRGIQEPNTSLGYDGLEQEGALAGDEMIVDSYANLDYGYYQGMLVCCFKMTAAFLKCHIYNWKYVYFSL